VLSVCSSKSFFDFVFETPAQKPSYLDPHPFTATGTLCGVSRYLLALFIAFEYLITSYYNTERYKYQGENRITIFLFINCSMSHCAHPRELVKKFKVERALHFLKKVMKKRLNQSI